MEIFFANNQILFRSENISFYTRLLEGNYPDTDRLIPTDFNTTITFDVVNLRQSMERARLLSSATQNGTVKLEIKGGVVSAHVHPQSPAPYRFLRLLYQLLESEHGR